MSLGLARYRSVYAAALMTPSPISLVTLLSAAVFLVRTAALMLGPLLVALAAAFHTSVAAAGQLAAAINLSWAITALFVGPVSDTYGRRRVGLTGLLVMGGGILGSILAWDYWALLVCRLLTGVGAAMIPPNSMAIIADHFPPAERGRPISILISASFLGPVLAIPLVALLADLGGWRAPFGVVGGLCLILWGFQWLWLPQGHTAGKAVAFLARFATLSRRAGIWHVLVANALYQTAAFALFTYLAAFLIRTYGMRERETALPLAVALLGAMLGSILGGSVAGRTWRIGGVALTLLVGGLFAAVVFVVAGSPWLTVLLAAVGAVLLTVFEPVTWALIAELAGESRATANGMLAVSNQLGATIGASVGGLLLAFGGFSLVGLLCLGAAVIAALVIGAKVRGIGAVPAQAAEA
jgi:MFS transporter, DHA1 family, inner membrane transport protein